MKELASEPTDWRADVAWEKSEDKSEAAELNSEATGLGIVGIAGMVRGGSVTWAAAREIMPRARV